VSLREGRTHPGEGGATAQGSVGAISIRSLVADVLIPRLLNGAVALVLSDTAPATAGGGLDGPAEAGRDPGHQVGLLSPRHAHDTYEVCWAIHGRCLMTVAGRTLLLDPSLACVVRPGEAHQLQPTAAFEPFETLWWHLRIGGLSLSLEGFASRGHTTSGRFVTLASSPVPVLAQVAQELSERRPHYDLLVRGSLLQLAAAALRELDEAAGESIDYVNGERRSSWHVQEIAQYVEAHHGRGITLAHLARVANLSPYYLTTLFRRYTGRGAMAYLNDVRHRKALALLRNTDLEVAEIAEAVGYQDPFYFSRAFKARQGYSPLHYRRAFRAAAPPAIGAPEDAQDSDSR
jgi:AraC-like DNA-binding protein/mannose-6-phosphate isomerase-like protein (cupin superfamily)